MQKGEKKRIRFGGSAAKAQSESQPKERGWMRKKGWTDLAEGVETTAVEKKVQEREKEK